MVTMFCRVHYGYHASQKGPTPSDDPSGPVFPPGAEGDVSDTCAWLGLSSKCLIVQRRDPWGAGQFTVHCVHFNSQEVQGLTGLNHLGPVNCETK